MRGYQPGRSDCRPQPCSPSFVQQTLRWLKWTRQSVFFCLFPSAVPMGWNSCTGDDHPLRQSPLGCRSPPASLMTSRSCLSVCFCDDRLHPNILAASCGECSSTTEQTCFRLTKRLSMRIGTRPNDHKIDDEFDSSTALKISSRDQPLLRSIATGHRQTTPHSHSAISRW